MLLQRIELQGFLSHRGCQNGNGLAPIEIDFRSSPLWLIHGPNGAGKSAIFDAITFALFKEHRGGGKYFDRLINDAADRAIVKLELALGGETYLIERTIDRRRQGASIWGIVKRWTGSEWLAEVGTENDVEAWVARKLRMSYETFVSAVVLRQGEADIFLKAKPKDRRERLMELLDLEFYEQLGEAATRRRNRWNDVYKDCVKQLERLPAITDADLETQRARCAEATTTLGHERDVLSAKEADLREAVRAAELIEAIAHHRAQQAADAEVIAEAQQIRTAAQRYRALGNILPQLARLWDARERAEGEAGRMARITQEIEAVELHLGRLTADWEAACRAATQANEVAQQVESTWQEACSRRDELNRALDQLERVERLEGDMARAFSELEPHRAVLDQAQTIERDHERYTRLREELPLLATLQAAERTLAQAVERRDRAVAVVRERKQRLGEAQAEEARLAEALKRADEARPPIREALEEARQRAAVLRDKLHRRDEIAGVDECPMCGSRLDEAEARARLQHERAHWESSLADLERETSVLTGKLNEAEQDYTTAVNAHKHAHAASNEALTELRLAEAEQTSADLAHTQASQTVAKARDAAGAWASELPRLDALQAELDALAAVPGAWERLGEARRVQHATDTLVRHCRDELGRLPQWSPEDRAQLRRDVVSAVEAVAASEQEKQAAAKQAQDAAKQRDEIDRYRHTEEVSLGGLRRTLDDLTDRKAQAEAEVTKARGDLAPPWDEHPACTDRNARQALIAERATLEDAEKREATLQQALERAQQLSGAIAALEGQLSAIPTNRRRPVIDVTAERNAAQSRVREAEEGCKQADAALSTLVERKRHYDDLLRRRDEAEPELGVYDKLAKAYGRDGLQARIVRQAQEAIKLYANATLARLSKGEWQIDLRENSKGTELEILARDLRHPNAPLREFSYISGGEKFRVAISVAVAIGQATSGGRPVDTLVIDEGFGSLDDLNRGLLVTELGRLSEEVLQGGRVIVVSHQQDVVEEFGSRYQLSRDGDGNVQIEYNPSA